MVQTTIDGNKREQSTTPQNKELKPQDKPSSSTSKNQEGSSLSTTQDSKEVIKDKLSLGKKFYLLKDYDKSLDAYTEALELQVKQHGEFVVETADIYFEYANVLLTKVEQESDVFGNVVKKMAEVEEPGMKEKIIQHKSAAVIDDKADPILGGEEEEDDDNEDEENVDEEDIPEEDSLEIAWDTLELARITYTKFINTGAPIKAKLSDVHVRIAEAAVLTSNYQQAIEDYDRALKLCEEIFSSDDRRVAEVHCAKAVTHMYLDQLDDALHHYKTAACGCESRLKKLKVQRDEKVTVDEKDNKGKKKESDKKPEEISKLDKEIVEFQDLIKELNEKIEDINLEKQTSKDDLKKLVAKETGFTSVSNLFLPNQTPVLPTLQRATTSSSTGSSIPVNNLGVFGKNSKESESVPKKEGFVFPANMLLPTTTATNILVPPTTQSPVVNIITPKKRKVPETPETTKTEVDKKQRL